MLTQSVSATRIAESGSVSRFSRPQLYSALFAIGFLNGVWERLTKAVVENGWFGAIFNTFHVSALIWAAAAGVFWLLSRSEKAEVGPFDYMVAVIVCIGCLAPMSAASWLAIAIMGFGLVLTTKRGEFLRRAGVLMFGMSIPMLWSRILFASMSNTILAIDAKMIGFLVGTGSNGNAVPFWDGTGVIFIAPACSSLTNVSLALLCGLFFMCIYNRGWSLSVIKALVAACVATVVINITRISGIAFFPNYYDLLHGPVGATIAEWLSIIAVLSIYFKWIGPDATDRA